MTPLLKTLRQLACFALPLAVPFAGQAATAGADDAPAIDLFVAHGEGAFAAAEPGSYRLRFDRAAAAVLAQSQRQGQKQGQSQGQQARVRIGDALDRKVRFERSETHANGDVTWVGQFDEADGASPGHRLILTSGVNGTVGVLRTPEGTFLADPAQGGRVRSVRQAGLQQAATCTPDLPVRPSSSAEPRLPQAAASHGPDESNQFASGETEVDVMVLYTPGLGSNAAGAATIINQLAATANQAYIDSQVSLRLRVVHSAQVGYSDDGSNDSTLDALSDGMGSAFANVESLRTQKGADLVVLVRPYDYSSHGSCGVAWLNGQNGRTMTADAGYAVVSYGDSSRYYCDDYTFAHELGHNMGSAHDQAHSSSQGAYPYSYGYGAEGSFGTIMSYINPAVGYFSNPQLNACAGRACGTSSANNALSLNNVRTTVAAFKAATQAPSLTGITLSSSTLTVGATATINPSPSSASLSGCSSSNPAVASVSGLSVLAVAAGNASISCGGFTQTLTVNAATPSPGSQAFAATATSSSNSAGMLTLSVGFQTKGSDIGKTADVLVVALVKGTSPPAWYTLTSSGWAAGLSFSPLARRTLAASESGFAVFSGNIARSTLDALMADVYIAYQPTGGSLVYGVAASYPAQ